MKVTIESSWKRMLQSEFDKPYFRQLGDFVKSEYKSKKVYPPPKQIFRAFDLCPFDSVKVVILGQDPYHGKDQANGLAFSVNDVVSIPPSLQNIYKEIEVDMGIKMPRNGNLDRWARQGVLLLNATLTVKAHFAGSHQGKGWEEFTDAAIQILSAKKDYLVFLLWGAYAKRKAEIIDKKNHLILTAPHPSPFSVERGFFGCRHFSKTNMFLTLHGKEPIDW